MGLFKHDTPPAFNPVNPVDTARINAEADVKNFTPQTAQITSPWLSALKAGGSALDQQSLSPAANAARLLAAKNTQKLRESRGGGGAFARNYADPNMLATQDAEQSKQEDESNSLNFMGAAADTYNQNLGLVSQQDQSKLNALGGILNSDTSRANANQAAVTSSYNTGISQPTIFGQLLGGISNSISAKITKACVAEGTLIRLVDGTERVVEELLPGDAILAFDPGSGVEVVSQVRQVISGDYEEMTKITGLILTPEHLVYLGDALFKPVGSIKDGDALAFGLVARIETAKPARPYYLGTDAPFTFYANGVAVHE
jgi:hypothetical protein